MARIGGRNDGVLATSNGARGWRKRNGGMAGMARHMAWLFLMATSHALMAK